MPITTKHIIFTLATLTVNAVGPSFVQGVTFESNEAAEDALEAAGYRYVSGVSDQLWSK